MGCWKSKAERLRLGETAVCLRDEEGLKWRQVTERLRLSSHSTAMAYYETYKEALVTAKSRMDLEQIEEFARRFGIERGYVWLYENGFEHRVPEEVKEKIENAKLKDAFE
ncbi:hypothetical protein ES703_98092 [subsurface metagenome]|nr:hypothetical protein [bacterium]